MWAPARRSTRCCVGWHRAGCAQLLVSSDAEELLEVCDRILVMRGGLIVEEVAAADATEASLLSAAAGL